MVMPFCSSLIRQGYCLLAGCPDTHVPVCDICDSIQLIRDPDSHYLSRKHLSTVYEKGARYAKHCDACHTNLDNVFTFSEHYMSSQHRANTVDKDITPYAVLHGSALRRCHPCNRIIPHGSWHTHVAGQAHSSKTAKTEMRTIASSSLTDFGIILGATGAATKKVEIVLPPDITSATLANIQIVSPYTPSP